MTPGYERLAIWAERIGSALLVLLAPLGAGILSVGSVLRRRHPPPRSWWCLWVPALLPVAVLEACFGHLLEAGAWGGEMALAILAGWFVHGRLTPVRRGLAIGLVVALAVLSASQVGSWILWRPVPHDDPTSVLVKTLIEGHQSVRDSVTRAWTIPGGTQVVEFHAQSRTPGGLPEWMWLAHSQVKVEPLVGVAPDAARIQFGTASNPYAQKWFKLGREASGLRFRSTLEIRANATIPGARCRGVRLQVMGPGGGASCPDTTIGPQWKRVTSDWTAPAGATSSVIRVVLNNLGGTTVDVRNLHLFLDRGGLWRELTPLQSVEPGATLSWHTPVAQHVATASWRPSTSWTDVTLRLGASDVPYPSTASILLSPNGIGRLDIRSAGITANGVPVPPVRRPLRQPLWYTQPNLAGHSLAAAGLLAMLIPGSMLTSSLVFVATCAAVWLTGSRTAFAAAVIGMSVLFLLRQRRHRAALVPALGIAVVASLALMASTLFNPGHPVVDTLTFGEGQQTPRHAIWEGAALAVVQHPLLGLVGQGEDFAQYWRSSPANHTGEDIQHAHNLWLQFASRYGLVGAFSVLWLTVGLIVTGNRLGGTAGLVFVASLLFMNVFDYTLFFSGVLLPLILGLNVVAEKAS